MKFSMCSLMCKVKPAALNRPITLASGETSGDLFIGFSLCRDEL